MSGRLSTDSGRLQRTMVPQHLVRFGVSFLRPTRRPLHPNNQEPNRLARSAPGAPKKAKHQVSRAGKLPIVGLHRGLLSATRVLRERVNAACSG